MGKNKQVACQICFKSMRSDIVKRHRKVHLKYSIESSLSTEDMCRDLVLEIVDQVADPKDVNSAMKRKHEEVECETQTTENKDQSHKRYELNRVFDDNSHNLIDVQALRKSIDKDEEEYKMKIELGREVYIYIEEAKVLQESLSKERLEALDLYIKQKQKLDRENTKLRPWQQSLLEYIQPTDREVIWVRGINGNEGKTWFQQFLKEKYGWSKAVTGMDIKAKNSSLCHALRKRSLVTSDIFLFNVGKAKTEADVNYEVLEKIKDGHIFASKYDSTELQFKTPNIVIVFSNERPIIKQLALDRWKIFSIQDNELIDFTSQYTKVKGVTTILDEDGYRTEDNY